MPEKEEQKPNLKWLYFVIIGGIVIFVISILLGA